MFAAMHTARVVKPASPSSSRSLTKQLLKTLINEQCKHSQSDKFKKMARELECDDDDERFKERLKKIVKQKL